MTTRFDAIVIGGGPAGGVAAMQFARMGWRVLLAERKHRNRDKACGYCMSARGVSMLKSLGLTHGVTRISRGLTSVLRLYVPNHRPLHIPISGAAASETRATPDGECNPGIVVRRDELDQMLLDAAALEGASVVQPAAASLHRVMEREAIVSIRHLEVDTGDTTRPARWDVVAPLVIGADGLSSRIAVCAGIASTLRAKSRYAFSRSVDSANSALFHGDAIDMFTSGEGYLGIVQSGQDRLHLAALVRSRRGGTVSPAMFLERLSRRFPILRDVCSAWSMAPGSILAAGPMPWRTRQVATERVALVGDAAGYVEPFTGEGMTWAIESAILLAQTLRTVAPGTWNRHCAMSYSQAWRATIEPRLRRCQWMTRAMEIPPLMSAMTSMSRSWPIPLRSIARRVVAA